MSAGQNDTEIINRILQGETHCYAELVKKYQDYVFTLTMRFTKNREDAEEVAQDIFIKAFRSLSDFRGASKFSTWLYTIVNTTCLTFLRKKKIVVESLDNEKNFFSTTIPDGAYFSNQMEQKSKVNLVNSAISLLSADDAEVITLFYKAEQSLEEISHILRLETNTVKVRLHRARIKLKEKMEKCFPQEVRDLN